MLGVEIENMLVEHLKHMGYPEDSLVCEMNLSGSDMMPPIRPDLVVLGPVANRPIAIFEVKSRLQDRSVYSAVRQLRQYRHVIRMPVRAFIVVPVEGDDSLQFYEVPEDASESTYWERRHKYLLPSVPEYAKLLVGLDAKYRIAAQVRREDRVDQLVPICFGLSGVLAFVFIVDFVFSKAHLNTQSVVVLGMSVVSLLLPYYDVISFKDISLSRKPLNENKGEKNES